MSATTGKVDRGLVPPTRPEEFGPPDALRTIVSRPRATMRWLLDHGDGGLWVLLLLGAFLAVAAAVLVDMARTLYGSDFDPVAEAFNPDLWVLAGWTLLFCMLGAVYFILGAALVARVLGGVARPLETLRAIAWGGLPLVAALPFVLASAFFDPFRAELPFVLLRLVGVVATLVAAVITVATFAEAQRFSLKRSAVAVLLSFAVAYGLGLVVSPVMPFPIHSIVDDRRD